MGILAEILAQVLIWLVQFIAELLLQLVIELIARGAFYSTKEIFRNLRAVGPWQAATGHIIIGAAAGGLSLWLFPDLFIKEQWLRIANLVLTPLAAGLVMGAIGSWRERKEKEVLRLESFGYGFCFAFAMSVIRYAFGK